MRSEPLLIKLIRISRTLVNNRVAVHIIYFVDMFDFDITPASSSETFNYWDGIALFLNLVLKEFILENKSFNEENIKNIQSYHTFCIVMKSQ